MWRAFAMCGRARTKRLPHISLSHNQGNLMFSEASFHCAPHTYTHTATPDRWVPHSDLLIFFCWCCLHFAREVTRCVLCIWYLDIVMSYHLFSSLLAQLFTAPRGYCVNTHAHPHPSEEPRSTERVLAAEREPIISHIKNEFILNSNWKTCNLKQTQRDFRSGKIFDVRFFVFVFPSFHFARVWFCL